jgi:hypothetical protein
MPPRLPGTCDGQSEAGGSSSAHVGENDRCHDASALRLDLVEGCRRLPGWLRVYVSAIADFGPVPGIPGTNYVQFGGFWWHARYWDAVGWRLHVTADEAMANALTAVTEIARRLGHREAEA